MSKQLYILSTATHDHEFPLYRKGRPGAPAVADGSVIIHGKAGLPNKHLLTPRGVSTPVTDEQIAQLEQSKVFCRMRDNGWFTVLNADPRDADKQAADQAEGDGSKQLTEAELAKKGKAAKPAKKDG